MAVARTVFDACVEKLGAAKSEALLALDKRSLQLRLDELEAEVAFQ